MSARLNMDERAELERLRSENRELREEVRAWVDYRPHSATADEMIQVGPFSLWPEQKRCEVDGRPIHVTGKQMALLACLARRKNHAVSKDGILDFLYGGLDEPELKVIDVMVCQVRTKLRQFGVDRHLQTVWGLGYRLSDTPSDDAYTQSHRPGGRPSRPAETIAFRVLVACESGPQARDVLFRRLGCRRGTLTTTLFTSVRNGWLRNVGIRNAPIYEITSCGRERLQAISAQEAA